MTDKTKPRRLRSEGRFRTIAIVSVSIVLVSILAGWEVGRILSPHRDTEKTAKEFIETHLKVDRLGEADVWLSARAGDADFTYQLSKDAVRVTLLPLGLAPKERRIRRNILNEHDRLVVLASMAAPAGTRAIGRLTRLAKSGSPRRRAVLAVAGLVAVAGGAIGFYFGYDESIDFDAPAFANGMRRAEVWRSLAVALRDCFIARRAEIRQSPGSPGLAEDPQGAAEVQRINADCAHTVLGSETR